MTDIILKSVIDVEEIQQVGSDETLARAAWVSTGKDQKTPSGDEIEPNRIKGLIKSLINNRHGSVFEHGFLTVRIHAPIKVWREFHRHRIGFSYNEESGRFKQLDPIFWVPPRNRPMIRPSGFKSMKPDFDLPDEVQYLQIVTELEQGYRESYAHYEYLLNMGVDRGLARDVLGVGIFSACWVSCNPRSIMSFLELRTRHDDAKRPSRPLWEIDNAARQLETIFAKHWPITHRAWDDNGRMAP